MAKESMKAREVKRQKLVAKYSKKRQELREAGDYIGLLFVKDETEGVDDTHPVAVSVDSNGDMSISGIDPDYENTNCNF